METREVPSLTQEYSSNNEKLNVHCFVSSIASDQHPDINQDAHFFDSDKGIFGIFDGVGGEKNGQYSAQTSSQIIGDLLNSNNHPFPRDVRELLKNACNLANNTVYNQNQDQDGGTTATFGLLCEIIDDTSQIALAHVGDSRAYLYRMRELSRLTTDDNLSKFEDKNIQNELDNAVNQDDLSQQASVFFETRYKITNSIGSDTKIIPKIIIKTVLPNDLVIMTTDGIHDNLTTSEISQIISQNSQNPELIPQSLTNAALLRSRENVFRSKPDDMTALVVTFKKEKD